MAKDKKLDKTAMSLEMAHPRITASALKAMKMLHENACPEPKRVKGSSGR